MVGSLTLLGRPGIVRDDGSRASPRGTKAWALLAYLVLTDRPASRRQLVALLFAEAHDPLGALRWNISEVRRAVRGIATLAGDPVVLQLAPGTTVDVRELSDGAPADACLVPGLGQDLLEGVTLPSAPAYEAWLAAERCRVRACGESVLLERALDLLAAGTPGAAAGLAARALAMNALNPDAHAVLVRSLGAAGDRAGARRQALRSTALFRRELGCAPPPEVLAATVPPVTVRRPAATASAVRSYLDAGRASMTAGAVVRGLEQLDRAAAMAVDVGDPLLRAGAFVALAGARVHGAGERGTAVRGLLQEAAALARTAGAGDVVAAACRELGFLALQRGRPDRAQVWLAEGLRHTTDEAERARLLGVRGMCRTDVAEYAGALDCLAGSVQLARRTGDARQEAWSLAMVGRVHVLRGEHARAVPVLDASLTLVERLGWTAFQPWPEAFRAGAATGLGQVGTAQDLLDHAWVLAAEGADHCWMATVAHGQAELAAAEGDLARARRWCDEGLAPAPWYLWPYARLLDVACLVAPPAASALGSGRLDRLTDLAARGSMHDLLARAHLHRARRGSVDGLEAARALAAGIDDPALHARIDRCAQDPARTGRQASRSSGRIREVASSSKSRSWVDSAKRSVIPET
jgi:DNA-binding SARP family transcriptional activator